MQYAVPALIMLVLNMDAAQALGEEFGPQALHDILLVATCDPSVVHAARTKASTR